MMNVTDVSRLQGTSGTAELPTTGKSASGSGDSFSGLFHSVATQVDKLETDAQNAVTGLLNGQGVEVHDAMIATQRSELAFQLALQVRNKAVSAYQTMMQMQF